jgi:glycosyltransferase involved in cell wall biosynthesis
MQKSSNRTTFHLWLPNIFEFKGGIQVYLAVFLKALQSLYPNSDYEVFLKHDTRSLPDLSFLSHTRFHFYGTWPLPLRTAVFASQIISIGLWQRPSLVISTHVNFTPAAYWLKRLTGLPYWVIAYGTDAWNIDHPPLQRAIHHADRILSISGYTRDRLLKEQNLTPAKISLLPCTFDASRFQIGPKPQHLLNRYRLTTEQPIILSVGRLDSTQPYKGYDKILRALPEIRRQIPNVHYILVGQGSDRPRIEQLIAQLNLQKCVTLAGFVPDNEIGDYYNLCDVFAMPSKGEGFGIVYLEALACGKPTLGGNQDGAIDALCNGELGALVDPDNVDALARTLIQILQGTFDNAILYQPESLRKKVIENFGFECFKQRLAELMESSTRVDA